MGTNQAYPINLSNPRDFDFFSLVKLVKDERCVFFHYFADKVFVDLVTVVFLQDSERKW